ncbi:unnamed protein product [Prorocentrum cordatum]|uniref:RNA helicase n=1 Tax=Prorocentrum cordatum TaxID=2364126 RepID=A0ABN9RAK6_9DINO|nr:unnamed protein product [Polarella glacialis]
MQPRPCFAVAAGGPRPQGAHLAAPPSAAAPAPVLARGAGFGHTRPDGMLPMAAGAACGLTLAITRRRAYGGGGGGFNPAAAEAKSRREVDMFFQYQRSMIRRGNKIVRDDMYWAKEERAVFKTAHVKAGINFAKYEDIPVETIGGTGNEQPMESFQDACEKFDIPEGLAASIERCGYDVPTPVQKYAIPADWSSPGVTSAAFTACRSASRWCLAYLGHAWSISRHIATISAGTLFREITEEVVDIGILRAGTVADESVASPGVFIAGHEKCLPLLCRRAAVYPRACSHVLVVAFSQPEPPKQQQTFNVSRLDPFSEVCMGTALGCGPRVRLVWPAQVPKPALALARPRPDWAKYTAQTARAIRASVLETEPSGKASMHFMRLWSGTAPTRELCQQIADEARRLVFKTDAKVVAIYGGAPAQPQLRQLAEGPEIVIATPGRLVDFLKRGVISVENVKFLALDEADRMLDMGFEPQIREIIEDFGMPEPGEGGRQTIMFSATFPEDMQNMALDFLDPVYMQINVGRVGVAAADVEQRFEDIGWGDKFEKLIPTLESVTGTDGEPKTIVFANMKATVDNIVYHINRHSNFRAIGIHGDKRQEDRNRAIDEIKRGRSQVLVATEVAARGLDLLPRSPPTTPRLGAPTTSCPLSLRSLLARSFSPAPCRSLRSGGVGNCWRGALGGLPGQMRPS